MFEYVDIGAAQRWIRRGDDVDIAIAVGEDVRAAALLENGGDAARYSDNRVQIRPSATETPGATA
ncbi:hypothetical protein [Mycobacterium sp. ACS1612]|uniref:hypothetical protein n=1 Tax=Mycobacterium sp. ACS1612 TaxID=1834117 RepID=UPI0009ECF4A6|nr:hypothetical protein [Mycobacterium sp. ACS1612]